MTLKEKLLQVFTEEEINDLVLLPGITMDMDIVNYEIESLKELEILIGNGNGA